jgi:hypothetical protein
MDLRLVCDRCFAFRKALDPELGSFVAEHHDCRPPLRFTGADDESIEMYRENYEEA